MKHDDRARWRFSLTAKQVIRRIVMHTLHSSHAMLQPVWRDAYTVGGTVQATLISSPMHQTRELFPMIKLWLCVMMALIGSLATIAHAKPTDEALDNIWTRAKLVVSDKPANVKLKRIPIQLRSTSDPDGYPLTFGIPLPKDEVFRTDQMRIVDAAGREVACSIIPTATWTAGGSLKWVLVDMASPTDKQMQHDAAVATPWTLEYGNDVKAAAVDNPVRISQTDKTIAVDTGRLVAEFSKTRGSIFEKITLNGQVMLDASTAQEAGLYYLDQDGKKYRSITEDPDYQIKVELATPMRVVIKATGWYQNEAGERACRYITRIYLYRNQPMVRLFTTWVVTVDTDTTQWQDLGLRLPMQLSNAQLAIGIDPTDVARQVKTVVSNKPVIISQNRAESGKVHTAGKTLWEGTAIGGWFDVTKVDGSAITLASPGLAGHFPAGFSVDQNAVVFHAFSPDAGHLLGFRLEDIKARYGKEAWEHFESKLYKDPPYDTRESQANGLAKTHELLITFRSADKSVADSLAHESASRMLAPPLAMASPQWNCDSGAFGPYHQYDEERFGDYEKRVSGLLDEWIYATHHMSPHYGFYDHGRGVPYHLEPVTDSDGKLSYIYSGYRRNYDLGYGNTVVPWLMYLRSGDRRWLEVGVSNTRYEMDVRHVHPTYSPGASRIGFKYWHYGSWSFDNSCLGFQDQWYKNLALCYYTTGYERAMDVYGEIMESMYDAFLIGKTFEFYQPTDRTGRTSMTGSVAVYYKSTWDPRFRELYEGLVPSVLATQRSDGVYTIRVPWMEQFFQESLYDMPNPVPEVVAAYKHFCETIVRLPDRARGQTTFAPFAYWWWFQQNNDPVVAAYAKEHLNDFMKEKYNLLSSFGMRQLLYYPLWQKLLMIPGAEDAELPQSVQINLPGQRPILLQHNEGKATNLTLGYLGGQMQAFDADGKQLSWLRYDESLEAFRLQVPANQPSQIITIKSTAPEFLLDKHNYPRLPWWPERDRAVLIYQGENPLVDTVLNPEPVTWPLPAEEDPYHPSGLFGRSLRLSNLQHAVVDLGTKTEGDHVRSAFDAREGTVEFFIRFEQPAFGGTLLELANEGTDPKSPAYQRALWMQLSSRWDVRMYNKEDEKPVLVIYRQQPQIIPGKWHHVAIMWDWNDRDAQSVARENALREARDGRKVRVSERGKIIRRLFLDGAPGPVVSGGGDDSRTYWLDSSTRPVPEQFLTLGTPKARYAVSIDELRISNVMRYPFGTLAEKSFTPPDSPFKVDEHTLLLHHFDELGDAIGRNQSRVPIEYIRNVPSN